MESIPVLYQSVEESMMRRWWNLPRTGRPYVEGVLFLLKQIFEMDSSRLHHLLAEIEAAGLYGGGG